MKGCLSAKRATVTLLSIWMLLGCAAPPAAQAHGADLIVTESADQMTVGMGEFSILIITVINQGPETASGILFGASLPPALKTVAYSCSAGSPTDGSFCELDHLASGKEAVAKVVVTPTADSIPTRNPVNVDVKAVIPEFLAFDPNRANNSAFVRLQILNSP